MVKLRGLQGSAPVSTPEFIPMTFRTGTVSAARFAPDGETVIYSAAWGGDPYALFMTRRGSPESRPLNLLDAKLRDVATLAWAPSGAEVWFAAARTSNDISGWSLRAVTLDGQERVLLTSAGTGLGILDVFRRWPCAGFHGPRKNGLFLPSARRESTAGALVARWFRARGALFRWATGTSERSSSRRGEGRLHLPSQNRWFGCRAA
jgi:hypothetical protein